MARIRSIKPDFFASEDVASLSYRARLTWVGLWTHCDDHGRCKDNGKLIKAALWALEDVSLADVEADLCELEAAERVARYEADSGRYVAIQGWHAHQVINRMSRAKFPAPPVPMRGSDECPECTSGRRSGRFRESSRPTPAPLTEGSVSPHGGLTSGREGKGKGREGSARTEPVDNPEPVDNSTPPPRRCPKHINSNSDDPCRACGDARRAHEDWTRAQRMKPTPIAGPGKAPRCELHPQEAAKACRCCAADAKAAG